MLRCSRTVMVAADVRDVSHRWIMVGVWAIALRRSRSWGAAPDPALAVRQPPGMKKHPRQLPSASATSRASRGFRGINATVNPPHLFHGPRDPLPAAVRGIYPYPRMDRSARHRGIRRADGRRQSRDQRLAATRRGAGLWGWAKTSRYSFSSSWGSSRWAAAARSSAANVVRMR